MHTNSQEMLCGLVKWLRRATPDNQPRTNRVEGENLLLKAVLQPPQASHAVACAPPPVHTNREIKK